jgi:predicted nucleic acid-binding protein
MGQLKIDSLPPGQVLALDTVTLIYFLERHPVYYPIVRELFKSIEENRFSAVISSLAFTELLVPAFRAGKAEEATKLQKVLTNFPHLETVPLTITIAAEAARLRADYGIRTPDAIHLATAIKNEAAGFITNDKKLQRLQNELSVWLIGG